MRRAIPHRTLAALGLLIPLLVTIPHADASSTTRAVVAEQSAATPASGPASGPGSGLATSDAGAARLAAGWLGRRFGTRPLIYTDVGMGLHPDPEVTMTSLWAFAATKTNDTRAARAVSWLTDPDRLELFLGDGVNALGTSNLTQLVLTLQIRGVDPTDVAGRNLIAELQSLELPNGRLSFHESDESDPWGQAWGIIALHRAGLPTTKAAGYLARQTCPDGGVGPAFDPRRCSSYLVTTAVAAQAFAAAGDHLAATKAANWLVRAQAKGQFRDTYEAAIAASGMTAVDPVRYAKPIAVGRAYIRNFQQGCAAPFARRGAIIQSPTSPSWMMARASAESILALTGANLATLTAAGSMSWGPTLSCS